MQLDQLVKHFHAPKSDLMQFLQMAISPRSCSSGGYKTGTSEMLHSPCCKSVLKQTENHILN